jgi:phosphoribosyl-dephospho-CoA transferase
MTTNPLHYNQLNCSNNNPDDNNKSGINILSQLKKQDENLDAIEKGLNRLQEVATNINTETKTQTKLLSALGNEVEVSTEKITNVNVKLFKTLKKISNEKPLLTMFILIVILLFLILLTIYV